MGYDPIYICHCYDTMESLAASRNVKDWSSTATSLLVKINMVIWKLDEAEMFLYWVL